MAKAILWILEYKRKKFPTNPAFHIIYRSEVIAKAKVNYQNLFAFMEKLIVESVVKVVPSYEEEEAWWAFVVTEQGEERLNQELKFCDV
jgi:hypothetical protein